MKVTANIDTARDWCSGMPAAVLGFPFGDDAAVYKVGDKIFALATVDAEPGYITVKVDPIEGAATRSSVRATT
jgi:predicted DNA-binding protein (MmcQ/YjbR family)